MDLITDPQAWASFLMLALLEMVLGIDNIIFLAVLVDRLPPSQRRSARLLGLGFAMLTRIALLYSITWIASMRDPWFTVAHIDLTGRDLVLFAGGMFLIVKSLLEIRDVLRGGSAKRATESLNQLWLVVLQIGVIDIVFSLDSVFTAIGLANRIEVMVAAIIASVLVMMLISSTIGAFIDRYPTVKVLALAFLVLVGGELVAAAVDFDIPKGYLYSAMAFSAVVEWINIRIRRPPPPA